MKLRFRFCALLLVAALFRPLGAGGQRPGGGVRVEWAPDGKVLVAAGGLLARFDINNGEEKVLESEVSAFALQPAGEQVALVREGRVELRRYPQMDAVRKLSSPQGLAARTLDWNGDGTTLAAGTEEGHILLWDARDGDLWADLNVAPPAPAERIAFSADGVRLLTAFADGRAVLWDVDRREMLHRFDWPGNGAQSAEGKPTLAGKLSFAAMSPDGREFLLNEVKEEGADAVLLDDGGRRRWRRTGFAVQFTGDGSTWLALVPPFRLAAQYRTEDARLVRLFEPPYGVHLLYTVRLSPDGKLLVGVAEDHRGNLLVLWDFATGKILETYR